MGRLTPFQWYWLFWFLVGFGVPEAYALVTDQRNTLSYQVWTLEDLYQPDPWTFVHFLILAFTVWLFFHFTFGMFR